jgi:hypothetical protein
VPVQSPGLGAKGQSIDAEGAIAAEVQVRIDSSIVIRPYGTASALPGLLYMPDPALQSAGTIAVEAFWFAPWDSPENSAFGLSSAMSLGGSVTLDLHASAETAFAAKPFNAGDLAASALVSLFGDAASAWSGAFFVRGGYSSAAAPSMPGAESAVEASLPLAARVEGPSKLDLRLALAPGGRADFSSPSPAYLGLVRAAFWLEGSSFRAGLSGELPLSFSGGALFSSAWPAKAALEGRFILGSTPFIAAAYATAEFPPSSAPSFGIGLGLGLLF